ncbi:MAG: hypothetical protein NC911_03390 [Candidatus Omnitrophica bacterium]|nr:hypothetical protein [Candidatus Omnitrophota bacterium]
MRKRQVLLIAFILLFTLGVSLKSDHGEIITSLLTVNLGKYQVIIEPSGRIREIKAEETILLERLGLFAYPIDSGRLFQGGGPPECQEKTISPTTLSRENRKIIIRREAVLGNEKFPEAVRYNYQAAFSPEGKVSISYEVDYLITEKWRAYAGEFIYRIPLTSIAGKGWIAENRSGAVNAGTNPIVFEKENRKQWVHIDDGSRLVLEIAIGQVELVPEGKSYLRGGIEGDGTAIYVISLPREPEISAGTKQNLQVTITLTLK